MLSHLLVEVHHELQLLRFMWADEDTRGAPPERIPMPWELAEREEADQALADQLRANAAEDLGRR